MNESRVEYDFRKIAEAMPQLVWTAAPDGRLDYFNQRWIDYTGYSLNDIGSTYDITEIVHPDDAAKVQALWDDAVAHGTPFEIEYRLRHALDGSYRWFLARAIPLRDAGVVTHWVGTATDVDEQKRARDSLAFVVEASSLFPASLSEDEICNELARLAIKDFCDWCFVTLCRNGRYETVAIAHRDDTSVRFLEQFRDKYSPQAGSVLAQVARTAAATLFERMPSQLTKQSVLDDEHLRLLRLLRMHSTIIVPLKTQTATEALGTVSFISSESGHLFDQADLDVATSVANRAALALDNARMFHDEKRTAQRLRFIAKTSQTLFESSDLNEIFDQVARLIVSEIADACFIARIDGDALRTVAAAHRMPAMQPLADAFRGARPMTPSAERTLLTRLRTNQPILREHLNVERLKEQGWPYLSPGIDALRPTSAMVVPLRVGKETYGAIFMYYTDSGRAYNSDDLPALMEIASRASIAVEHMLSRERERRIAETFQAASLPSLIPQPAGLHFNAVYSPAGEDAEVGGDWYDAIDLDDGSVVISVGDVTGRGLEAAVIMSKVRHAMGVLPRHERDPSKILDSAGWFLRKRYPEAIVTAFVGIISPDRRTLTFANAGHPYPILRRGDELMELRATGMPLGLRVLTVLEPSQTIQTQNGDLLVLFTDGLIEWGHDWEQGDQRLREVLQSDAVMHSLEPARLIERACIPGRAHDDVAVLTVEFGERSYWSFKADDARAAENARSQLVKYMCAHTGDHSLVETGELVFGELIGNVVRHAPGPVEVRLEWNGGHPVLHVIDSGPSFTVPYTLPSELSETGRGLFIVQMVSENILVERIADSGNHVRVTLPAAV